MADQPTDVDGVDVTGTPGWGFGNFKLVPDDQLSSNERTAVETRSLQDALEFVILDPSVADNEIAQEYARVAESAIATLSYVARMNLDKKLVDLPGTQNDMTGRQLLDALSRTTIVIQPLPGPNTAERLENRADPNNTNWIIRIDPLKDPQRFPDPATSKIYTVLHEIGHANFATDALARSLMDEKEVLRDPDKIVEKFANAVGAEFAQLTGFPYPTPEMLGPYNGMPPADFVFPQVGFIDSDMLRGDAGNDIIAGMGGNDTLSGGAGADVLNGGEGADTASYQQAASGVRVDLAAETVGSIEGDDRLISIENVTGSAYRDEIYGSAGDNYILGEGGDDLITGGEGNDTIYGGDGNDYMQGNAGLDFMIGGTGNDSVLGSRHSDIVRGGQGNDQVYGDLGADVISGDRGSDTIYGGGDADIFNTFSDADLDYVYDFNAAEGDRVRVEYGSYSVYQGGSDTVLDFNNGSKLVLVGVTGFSNSYVTGGQLAGGSAPAAPSGLILHSDQAPDVLIGDAGADTIYAGQGADQLTGNGGADVFVFGQLPWSAGAVTDFATGTDKIDLRPLLQASGYAGSNPITDGYVRFESDGVGGTKVMFDTDGPGAAQAWAYHVTTLKNVAPGAVGVGDLLVTGGASQPPPSGPTTSGQVLTSTREGDVLVGGAGGDTLNAGQGPDQLTGGAGADRFVFAKTPWNAGQISDFVHGVDKIDVSGIFAATGYSGSDPIGAGWLRLDAEGGGTKVYLDVDGPAGDEWPITITTLSGVAPSSVSLSDFIL